MYSAMFAQIKGFFLEIKGNKKQNG